MIIASTIARTPAAFLRPMATELANRGHRVAFACNTAFDAQSMDAMENDGFAVHHVDWQRSPTAPSNLRAIVQLRRLIADHQADVVEVHTPVAAALTRVACRTISRKRRPAVVYFAHGFHFQSNTPDGAARVWLHVEKALRRLTDRLVVINDADLALGNNVLGYGEADCLKLPGVGLALNEYTPSKDHRPTGIPVIAVIGALNPGKRPLEAVQAAAALPTQAKLLFAGDGPLDEDIRAEAKRLDVDVEMLGRIPDIRPVLEVSSLLLFLSEREGLPRTVLEAVSMGVPVVAHNIRGVVDILEGQPWWHEPEDRTPDAVASAIVRALHKSNDVGQMRRSIARFDDRDVARIHADFIEDAA